ncbi:glycosyltransferase involved in cell wall biosynthesis [Duganella sp. 1411]|uniref:glycosyltransferase family 2 protein n=1 Tax=Duganella sp. 1411 TaxID=2806572 RepID=UPI001AEB71BD|nr:glycosyltransferase [Duganella sp. 1411]MBP1207915.1 glycosyltransferase involved in cell wall biosynthesis [Duganella sp. 1411]
MGTLVTIYIPTKNREALLRRAVQSVLGQTHADVELIIVSDGATDGTCDYVRSLQGRHKVKLIHNETSRGACVARNQALDIAEGEFITGLDDDDMFLPHRLERFLTAWRAREQTGERFSCLFDRRIVDQGGAVTLANAAPVAELEALLSDNIIGNQVFTTPARMREVGGFDAAMPAWQDWEMWVRLVAHGGPAHNIGANSYLMDVSHEFERITLKSGDKIIQAARLFHAKHGKGQGVRPGLLGSLCAYPQIELSLGDLLTMAGDPATRGHALRRLRRGKFKPTMAGTLA